jgi:hypothetical protein
VLPRKQQDIYVFRTVFQLPVHTQAHTKLNGTHLTTNHVRRATAGNHILKQIFFNIFKKKKKKIFKDIFSSQVTVYISYTHLVQIRFNVHIN